jgi:hypothetical protein
MSFFLKNLRIQNKNTLFKYFVIRNFNSKNISHEIRFNKNENEKEVVDIRVPADLQPLYSFGTLGHLPLYENSQILGSFTSFIPAPKINTLIFGIYTYLSYGTPLFQPSLLLTLYAINKIFLGGFGKMTQVLYIALEQNKEFIYAKTLLSNYRFKIKDVTLNKNPIVLGDTYYELSINKLNFSLFISSKGTILNYELLNVIFDGQTDRVNMIYGEEENNK